MSAGGKRQEAAPRIFSLAKGLYGAVQIIRKLIY
jgi:hypothetical protein